MPLWLLGRFACMHCVVLVKDARVYCCRNISICVDDSISVSVWNVHGCVYFEDDDAVDVHTLLGPFRFSDCPVGLFLRNISEKRETGRAQVSRSDSLKAGDNDVPVRNLYTEP